MNTKASGEKALLNGLDALSKHIRETLDLISEGEKFTNFVKSFKSDEEFDAYYISGTYEDNSGMLAFMVDEDDIVHRSEALKSCALMLQEYKDQLKLFYNALHEISSILASGAEKNDVSETGATVPV
mmetsp:Transcript_2816/g.3571  ORF Transcript_2816/g.3571 Transcript_2816/m.3571 type:complete len:127 (+) Transcript_2816:524-904(+)|eukprot:CAMPEP_0204843448 /NCGR_PEP_ID=MMETSP1346-20131115/47985_1 /ASSEMBLY_ACC=CAM_ASM_000771 /TAXON_ID=215587 /ORGANISM="Aplanochytrium stocchinoi, Strain GSBS06" /LENGTH=126 /DNA_ID=CAMNT_0051982595 /DNA_START=676 /DNA_END=1056 /DNA_ORIENTATION=-